MLFRKKRLVQVTFVDAVTKVQIGHDELGIKAIPVDFDVPTQVEIDGKLYELKASDPSERKAAGKLGKMTVWVELLPVVVEEKEDKTVEEVVPVVAATRYYRTPSVAEQQPRFSGNRVDYRVMELSPWEWRENEFVRREFAPEIGEDLMEVSRVAEEARVEVNGEVMYQAQYARVLTNLPLRGLEVNDIAVQVKYFPLATRLDGVAVMGMPGFVDLGFAYRLRSGLGLYGQEIDGRLRALALSGDRIQNFEALEEDVNALLTMMDELGLILMDWGRQGAVEANVGDLVDYLQRTRG